MNTYVSDAVVRRLPRYRRYLIKLKKNGVTRISSKELGEIMDVTASQIRQDLNRFGGFGQQGYGYSVDELITKLEEIMGINKVYRVGVIGCGRLGSSLISYLKQEPIYKITALCDNRPDM
ncbi:MAG: redox-sensing transcriptional repressor Rex, partial [Lachnospiraceae bacterium]|nr:redox-sensing transcriptional repressor Rex [Lachnospiraceae bacterium]